MSSTWISRRRALQSLLGVASIPAGHGQTLVGEPPGRITPVTEFTNVFEILGVAKRKLSDDLYGAISGTDRRALDRITFRPRLMVNVSKLDLTTEIFGQKLFSPILVGPVSHQRSFHPDAEVAMARGASAANTLMVISSRSDRKLGEIVSETSVLPWFQIYADPEIDVSIASARAAVAGGCKAVCLTVGVPYQTPRSGDHRLQAGTNLTMSWELIDRVRQGVKAPLLLKGVMSPDEATVAVSRGIDGIIVSNHGGMYTSGFADPIEMLPSVVDSIGGKIPVLVDGSFRRGTDVLKALALGARAVLLGRPPVWGLTAYGSDGVRTVLEMLQTELARNMAMCGKPDLKSVERSLVRIHSR